MEGTNWLALVVPILAALGGGAVASFLTRKSNKETNVTNAFNVVVTQLLSVNDSLRKDVEQSKRDISDLTTKFNNSESEVRSLRNELEEVKDANRMLAEQLAKLVEAWPPGTAMPPVSQEWRKYLN